MVIGINLIDLISVWLEETNKKGWKIQSNASYSSLAFWASQEEIYWNLYCIIDDKLYPVWPFTGLYYDKPLVDVLHSFDPDFFLKLEAAMDIANLVINKLRSDTLKLLN